MTSATILLAASLAAAQGPGSPDVAARLEELLEAMGGRAAWAAAQAIKVDATHYSTSLRLPHRNEIWNDFRAPRLRILATSAEMDRELVLDGDKGTRRDRADTRPLTGAEIDEHRRWWESNVYRTLHRLAKRDPDLSVRMIGPNRIAVFRKDGVRLNWLELNQQNEPILFGAWDSDTGTVFGPLTTSPSGLRHSKWVTSGDGTWRVELGELTIVNSQGPTPNSQKGSR
jgi:hypothetical protein